MMLSSKKRALVKQEFEGLEKELERTNFEDLYEDEPKRRKVIRRTVCSASLDTNVDFEDPCNEDELDNLERELDAFFNDVGKGKTNYQWVYDREALLRFRLETQQRFDKIEKRLEHLISMIECMPGGPVMEKAEAHFKDPVDDRVSDASVAVPVKNKD